MLVASDAFEVAAREGKVITKAVVTLRSGATVLLGPTDIMQGGTSFSSATSSSAGFDVGAAVIGRCSIKLRNEQRQLDGYDFSNALVIPYVGAQVGDSVEWLRKGAYWVEPFDSYGETVTLSCVDGLCLLEVPYDDVLTQYPATLGRIVRDACEHVGLELESSTFPNSGYIVNHRPSIQNTTALEVVAWAAQIAGCFADMSADGKLRIRWYELDAFDADGSLDGGGFHAEVDTADGGGFHFEVDSCNGGTLADPLGVTALKSIKAAMAPRVVTGLSVTAADEVTESSVASQGEQILQGSDGYVIHIDGNPIIDYGRAFDVAANVAPSVIGLSLRSVSATMVGSPTLEAGDPVVITDRHGVTYRFWATQVSWTSSGTLSVACDVKTASPFVRAQRRSQQQVLQTMQQSVTESQIQAVYSQFDSAVYNSPTFQQTQTLASDISSLSLSDLSTDYAVFGDISTNFGSMDERVTALEDGLGGWTIQINGSAKSSGIINFIT